MSKVASIKKQDEKFVVTEINEFESIQFIDEMRRIMNVDYLIIVDSSVSIGDIYDPETEDFINSDNKIVFNSMNDTKRIAKLENILNEKNKKIDITKLPRDEQYEIIIKNIKADCERVILAGFDAVYPMSLTNDESYDINTVEKRHYSLSINKQKDLEKNIEFIRKTPIENRNVVLYRDDSLSMLEEYTVDDFSLLYRFLSGMITACKIKSDGLEQLTTELYNSGDNFSKIDWNTMLPDRFKNKIIEQINFITRSDRGSFYYNHISKIDYENNVIIFN